MAPRILIIDNYDSFVYNLAQELGELGAEPIVRRHDEIDVTGVRALRPDALVVSPGPGRPEDAGCSVDVVRSLAGEIAILGVCLGHQVIATAFGARVVQGRAPMHGKTSEIHHCGSGIFQGLPDPFVATRYHSLVVEAVPETLVVTATTEDGTIMGLRHRDLLVEGVQFHPESILTDTGPALLSNFLGTLVP